MKENMEYLFRYFDGSMNPVSRRTFLENLETLGLNNPDVNFQSIFTGLLQQLNEDVDLTNLALSRTVTTLCEYIVNDIKLSKANLLKYNMRSSQMDKLVPLRTRSQPMEINLGGTKLFYKIEEMRVLSNNMREFKMRMTFAIFHPSTIYCLRLSTFVTEQF